MSGKIQTDYLIVGAGGMGMAFADEILTHTDATVTIVDRNHKPGGHWLYAYPFVRLHQPSTAYGVNSMPFGWHEIDRFGLNKGCYQLASGSAVVGYFDDVMYRRFIPSGRVKYLPMFEYKGDGLVESSVCGTRFEVESKKLVDSTYMNVTVPSQRPPKFDVAEGVACVPPNDIPALAPSHKNFVIVGSGKTGIDSCLFLLENGVTPERIHWVMPNDAYYFDRATVNPGRKFTDDIIAGRMQVMKAALESSSQDDFFGRLLEIGQLIQLDPEVKPTRWRCATISQVELDHLRRINNITRRGHVKSVDLDRIHLEDGSIPLPDKALVVDCAADGLEKRPAKPVFDEDLITLQTVRMCQQVYSAGFIGNVEAKIDGEDRKNALCKPVPHPYLAEDYLRCAIQDNENMATWIEEPIVVKWMNEARIDLFSPIFDFDDPEACKQIESMGELLATATPKLKSLLAGA